MRTTKAVAIAVLAAALAGCGGSDDSGSDGGDVDRGGTTAEPSRDGQRASGRDERRATGGGPDTGGASGRLTARERGQEIDRARQLVHEYVAALDAQDESVCVRLFDQGLVKPAQRDEARARCQRTVATLRGGVELVKIERLRVRRTKEFGREAIVHFLVRQQDRRTVRVAFHLAGAPRGYRIDRGIPVKQPRR